MMNKTDDPRLVLVPGGAGYVGSVVVRQLLATGCRVRVFDNLVYGHGASLGGVFEEPGYEFVFGDIRDRPALDQAMDGVTDVVLLAGLVGDPVCKKYADLAMEANEAGVRNVYLSAIERGVEKFVFTSTCSNYGLRDSDEPATEESELAPVSQYAESKVSFERFLIDRAEDESMSATILRIATAYGMSARMRFDLTVSEFTRTLAAGETLVVYDADTWRPYCHVADISKAILTVLGAPRSQVHREVFNVGHSDENYTKRMVVDTIGKNIDLDGRVEFVEGGVDPRNYRVSFQKIADRLGYEPDHRVPDSVANLVTAVQVGAFHDVGDRPHFYTNHHIGSAEGAAV